MDETKLRERLSDLAGDVPPVGTVPDGLVPRARRRAVVTSAASVLGVVAVLAVSFAGVRQIMRAEPVEPGGSHPTHHVVAPKPSPTPKAITTAPVTEHPTAPSTAPSVAPEPPGNDRITVVLADGNVVAIDPDNDPSGSASLGLADRAIPLAWAPDGRLAFTVDPGGGLFQMDASGGITQLADGTIYGGSYSADGTELVYSVATGHGADLHVVGGSAANGPHDEVLYADPSTASIEPSVAPDGQTIAFLRGDPSSPGCDTCPPWPSDGEFRVWAIDLDGSNLRQVSGLSTRGASAPSWSPDGTAFAVSSWDSDGVPQVAVVDVRTGDRIYQVSSANGQAPAWSPTGQAIAFVTRDGNSWTVHLVDTDGANERPLLTPPVDPSSPVLWSHFPAE